MTETLNDSQIAGLSAKTVAHVVHYRRKTYVTRPSEGYALLKRMRTLLKDGTTDLVPLVHRDGFVWLAIGPRHPVAVDEIETDAGPQREAHPETARTGLSGRAERRRRRPSYSSDSAAASAWSTALIVAGESPPSLRLASARRNAHDEARVEPLIAAIEDDEEVLLIVTRGRTLAETSMDLRFAAAASALRRSGIRDTPNPPECCVAPLLGARPYGANTGSNKLYSVGSFVGQYLTPSGEGSSRSARSRAVRHRRRLG